MDDFQLLNTGGEKIAVRKDLRVPKVRQVPRVPRAHKVLQVHKDRPGQLAVWLQCCSTGTMVA